MAGGLEPLGNPLGKSVCQSSPSSVFFYLTYREHFYTPHMSVYPSLGCTHHSAVTLAAFCCMCIICPFPPFLFLGYFKADTRHHITSPVNTSVCILKSRGIFFCNNTSFTSNKTNSLISSNAQSSFKFLQLFKTIVLSELRNPN